MAALGNTHTNQHDLVLASPSIVGIDRSYFRIFENSSDIEECFLDLGLHSCCSGLEEKPSRNDEAGSAFSFDDENDGCGSCHTKNGATTRAATERADHETRKPLTPATQPLSPSELSSGSSSSGRGGIRLKPLFGEERVAAGHGKTTILVLSREDDGIVDEIPDMSPTDDNLSEAGSYRSDDEFSLHNTTKTKFRRPRAKLVSLADVLTEVLRVLVFFLSATGRVPKPILSRDHKRKTVASH